MTQVVPWHVRPKRWQTTGLTLERFQPNGSMWIYCNRKDGRHTRMNILTEPSREFAAALIRGIAEETPFLTKDQCRNLAGYFEARAKA